MLVLSSFKIVVVSFHFFLFFLSLSKFFVKAIYFALLLPKIGLTHNSIWLHEMRKRHVCREPRVTVSGKVLVPELNFHFVSIDYCVLFSLSHYTVRDYEYYMVLLIADFGRNIISLFLIFPSRTWEHFLYIIYTCHTKFILSLSLALLAHK